ncbi:MAG: hypothetical protein WCX64_01335 [Candidatus Micrarchaeia archaeon]
MEKTSRATASAPNKIILAGEHSVVYGGKAISVPVEVNGRRNGAIATVAKGSGRIAVTAGRQTSTLSDGLAAGDREFFPVLHAVGFALQEHAKQLAESDVHITLHFSGAPKGTGNSASMSAAAVCASCAALGCTLTNEELFNATMVAENEYHAGKASGLDPMTVCSDEPLVFRKEFSKKGVRFDYVRKKLSLPKGTSLLLVNALFGGKRAYTDEMISAFAQANRIDCAPDALPKERQKSLVAAYDMLVEEMEKELHPDGSMETLGELFDENHALLSCSGVSCHSIERVRKVAANNGALGSKLTGAGGNGGCVLVLSASEDEESIRDALEKQDFRCFNAEFSHRGAGIDR